MGFSLTGLNFAFATATDVSDSTRTWMALDAVATGVAFNGVPGVSIAASSLDLALNRPASDSTLINFAAQPLTLKTGPATTRVIDLTGTTGPLLEASGTLTIDVAGFFRVSGCARSQKVRV
jgi:hypothetical protein